MKSSCLILGTTKSSPVDSYQTLFKAWRNPQCFWQVVLLFNSSCHQESPPAKCLVTSEWTFSCFPQKKSFAICKGNSQISIDHDHVPCSLFFGKLNMPSSVNAQDLVSRLYIILVAFLRTPFSFFMSLLKYSTQCCPWWCYCFYDLYAVFFLM